MRLPGFPVAAAPASIASDRAERPEPGAKENLLLGSWSATRWQYTSREDQGRAVDVVCDLSGVVTLSLGPGTYVLTYDVAGRAAHSVGGTFVIEGDELEMMATGAAAAERVRFRQGEDTLTLSADDSGWDFDGDGRDEAASLVAVFVRL